MLNANMILTLKDFFALQVHSFVSFGDTDLHDVSHIIIKALASVSCKVPCSVCCHQKQTWSCGWRMSPRQWTLSKTRKLL